MKPALVFSLLLLTPAMEAQPFQDFFVANDANYALRDPIAPGSIFNLWIAGSLGTLPVHADQGFPLRTSLDGVSVRVTVGATAVDAFVISTELVKIRALLPSTTPLGDGAMTLTINGHATAARKIRIVKRGFALYAHPVPLAWWPRGHALAHVVDARGAWSPNALVHPARPGQLLVLWGTGLGAAAGDERSGPLPGDARPADLEVLAGGTAARVLYAGRSGCCAGLDQIVIEVPAGVEGCSVPLWVRFRETGEADQLATPIASGEDACPDLPRDVAGRLDAAHAINIGYISLGAGHAVFGRASYIAPPPGTCRLGGSPPGEIDFSFNESTRDQAGIALNVRLPKDPSNGTGRPTARTTRVRTRRVPKPRFHPATTPSITAAAAETSARFKPCSRFRRSPSSGPTAMSSTPSVRPKASPSLGAEPARIKATCRSMARRSVASPPPAREALPCPLTSGQARAPGPPRKSV